MLAREYFLGGAMLTLFVGTALTPVLALEKYDPYPWCAVYGDNEGAGGTNCGFLTIEQCRATISGIGGSCEPNQFYNPKPTARARKKSVK